VSERLKCTCGWPRPAIAVTTRTGQRPAEDLVPIYLCPQCGEPYAAVELGPGEFNKLIDVLAVDLVLALKAGAALPLKGG